MVTFGRIVEGASQEMEKRGPDDDPRWERKYTMAQLLDPDFRLPPEGDDAGDLSSLQGTAGFFYDEVD